MSGEANDSHRKHRRSSDDEADKSLKRHKHRRHHSHRRHRHRHGSKKREEEMKIDGEDVDLSLLDHSPARRHSSRLDDDVEEGEILEEEGGFDGDGLGKRKVESDVESGEFKAVEVRSEADDQNLGDNALKSREDEHKYGWPVEDGNGSARNLKTLLDDRDDDVLVTYSTLKEEDISNIQRLDDAVMPLKSSAESRDEIFTKHSPEDHVNGEFVSPSRGNGKRKRYHKDDYMDADKSKLTNRWKSSSPESIGYKNVTLEHSPSRSRNHDTVHTRNRSMSRDHARVRSRSHSIAEDALLERRHGDDDKTVCDSDAERMVVPGSGDFPRNETREHSTSYSKYTGAGEERHRSREARHRDSSRERETEKGRDREHNRSREIDQKRDKVRERSREMERGRERERDRSRDMDQRRDKERERSRDRVRRREKEREMSRDQDLERDRRREKEREMSRDRDLERDRRREKERERSRDRDLERDRTKENERDRNSRDRPAVREQDIDRERGRENNSNRDRDGYGDWKRESERERRSDNSRDKVRDPSNNRKVYENLKDGYGGRDNNRHSRHSRHDETENQLDKARKNDSGKALNSKSDYLQRLKDKQKRDEDEQEDFEEKVALQLADQEEDDLDRIKEESRRRRQAILEKYKTQQLEQPTVPHIGDGGKDREPTSYPNQPEATSAVPKVPDGKRNNVDVYVADPSVSVGKSPLQNGIVAIERALTAGGLGEGTPKSERSDDMFCDDIFGESPAGVRKSGKGDGLHIEKSGLHDNWDDADGYYSYRFGEVLDSRYEVTAAHGKGVFSTVVRARDLKAGNGEPEEVAIKIIRSNLTKACVQELGILKKLVGADPEDKRHCVRFLSSFKYRNHLCLVFESLHMNLREVLKKFGRNIGLKLTAVRAYSKQLFIALKHLRNCGVLHCDIKPDNMLVNEAKNVLKLCDFGNAMFAGKNEITPYLVSRFYRAPEIILGLPYDHPLDIWSVGCCLYELYTGKVLFPGSTNNDMLRLHMELKGAFPKKMLRKGGFMDQHFDQDLNFHATEEDPVTKKTIKRIIVNLKPKDIGSIIPSSPGEDPKMVANFRDLLEKIFVLDPEKRLTVSQALNHPFITGK